MYRYYATVERVVDADTLDLKVDVGFNVQANIRVRLSNLNAPETYGVKKDSKEYELGVKATDYVKNWLNNNSPAGVIVETYKNKTGKYGRWLAVVYSCDESKNLNEDLVNSGHAEKVIYD